MTKELQIYLAAGAAVVAICLGLYWLGDGNGYKRAMTEVALAPRDTVRIIDTVQVPGISATLDSARAELREANGKIVSLNRQVWTRESTIAFYRARLDELQDSLAKPPVAILDTVLVDKENKDSVALYTEYHYPPINQFLNTSILSSPRPVEVQTLYITKTVVQKPAWWVKPVTLASGLAAGYFTAKERYWEGGLAAIPGVILLSIDP